MSDNAKYLNVTESSFDKDIIEASKSMPVLVDFWAEWCGPCRMLTPVIEQLAEKYEGKAIIAKANVDENQSLASKFGITGIPAIKIFKDGEIKEDLVGVQPEPVLSAAIDKYL